MREFLRRRPWMWIVAFCVLFMLADIAMVLIAVHDAPKSLIP